MTIMSSQKLLECIPNFSEGNDSAIIQTIAEVLSSVEGAYLLHQDIGESANRTVMTIAGEPEAVVEAAFRGIQAAVELINMEMHTGVHPRMGATDVCPLVPLGNLSMAEADILARKLGKRVGEELGIPVYLYEASASSPTRTSLASIRKGEYEGIAERVFTEEWKPDFGPQIYHKKAGQTAIGARELMLAYNVNLNTKDAKLAHEVAKDVRESGRKVKDPKTGKTTNIPGSCKGVKAIGWYMEEYQLAQVSTNVTRLQQTDLLQAFLSISDAAEKRGLQVSGSELIGLVPLASMLEAGRYFSKDTPTANEDELIHAAVKGLGMDSLAPFDPEERIIELKLAQMMR
ncbi:MAG: glutamate formimidoyltransferase [Bacteroidota bacterium]